jgi:hypothetical protein
VENFSVSNELPSQTGDLGPQPKPDVEPKEPTPGGADAVAFHPLGQPADLDPAHSPVVEEEAPELLEELEEGEDTDTEATKDGEDVPPEAESPA